MAFNTDCEGAFWLGFLRDRVGWDVGSVATVETLRDDEVRVVRLGLDGGADVPKSVIAKVFRGGMDRRDLTATSELQARLHACGAPIANVYAHGPSADGACWVRLSEDLWPAYGFRDHPWRWTQEEISAVAEAVSAFHAAGLRMDLRDFEAEYPCRSNLNSVDGAWIERFLRRAAEPPIDCHDRDAMAVIGRVAQRYDVWNDRTRSWRTCLHGDVFWGNTAMRRDEGGRWQCVLIDVEETLFGVPQYEVEYMAMRGWKGNLDWQQVRRVHRQALRDRFPGLFEDDALWEWGRRLGLLQLMVYGMRFNADRIDRLMRGELSEAEAARVRLGDAVFDRDLIAASQSVLDSDPWA